MLRCGRFSFSSRLSTVAAFLLPTHGMPGALKSTETCGFWKITHQHDAKK